MRTPTNRMCLALLCAVGLASGSAQSLIAADFNAESEGWNVALLNDAAAQGNLTDGDYCLDITNGGPDVWSVQLGYAGSASSPVKPIPCRFDAYASRPRGLRVAVGKVDSADNAYAETLDLTTDKQTFTDTFTAEDAVDAADLTFFSGGERGEANPAATVCFDNVSLGAGAVQTGENLLQNSGFDEGDANWSLGADAPAEASGEVVDGAYCALVSRCRGKPLERRATSSRAERRER